MSLNNFLAKIDIASVSLSASNYDDHKRFWDENKNRLLEQIKSKIPRNVKVEGGKSVRIDVVVETNDAALTMNTNESYKIAAADRDDAIDIKIESPTIYGARHGIETLSQLVVFDDIRRELLVRMTDSNPIFTLIWTMPITFRLLRNLKLLTNQPSNTVDCC